MGASSRSKCASHRPKARERRAVIAKGRGRATAAGARCAGGAAPRAPHPSAGAASAASAGVRRDGRRGAVGVLHANPAKPGQQGTRESVTPRRAQPPRYESVASESARPGRGAGFKSATRALGVSPGGVAPRPLASAVPSPEAGSGRRALAPLCARGVSSLAYQAAPEDLSCTLSGCWAIIFGVCKF